MNPPDGLAALAQGAIVSPFTRTRRLLERAPAGHAKPIDLTIGDPREVMPAFVPDRLSEANALFASYPKIRASDDLRNAIAAWIGRRYGIAGEIDAEREILPVSGSREGLFFAAMPAAGRKRVQGRPAILSSIPSTRPIWARPTPPTASRVPQRDRRDRPPARSRCAGARAGSAGAHRGPLFVLAGQPAGCGGDPAYIRKALALARQYDFMLFFDECYSEIYTRDAPIGALQVALETPERFKNLVVFNSLSKRSNLPGMRSGFAAGDGAFLETLAEIRNMIAPTMPGPVQHASAAVWSDEPHVAAIREAYRANSTSAMMCSAAGLAMQGRPAVSFFGST